jgi:hypothetical protein
MSLKFNSSLYKLELYLKFISFDIKIDHHSKYKIKHNLLSMKLNKLRLYSRIIERTTYMLDYNVLVLCICIVLTVNINFRE